MCGFLILTSKNAKQIPELEEAFQSISHRGPDDTRKKFLNSGEFIGFHRLAIMDTSHSGDQPFESEGALIVCNGEIYNHRKIKKDYPEYPYQSESDCEVLMPLFKNLSLKDLCQSLDAEFAFVLYDKKNKKFLAARDPMGIRPLFYGKAKKDDSLCFASEIKALHSICEEIKPFPPGHYFDGEDFHCFHNHSKSEIRPKEELETVTRNIRELLTHAVIKRLDSDVPLGFLLSGGLDSSLVCAIAARHLQKPITTFAVGITENPIDTKYAKIVSDYIGSIHHEVLFTKEETLAHLSQLIYQLETWDITTIRAAMGMSLICKYIKEQTKIKVVLTGEVSDELFGYKYTDFAPSPEEFQKEAEKRVRELYLYDVLRADRSISAHSLEARVPFSDKSFVDYVMGIEPSLKMNTYHMGKYLLRKSFEQGDYLPEEILYRQKAAFSDAVGHSMVDWLKAWAEEKYSDADLEKAKQKYSYATPFTKESLWYRDIFESHFPNRAKVIPDFWMPNQTWENCNVKDPSARVLPNYGGSGS